MSPTLARPASSPPATSAIPRPEHPRPDWHRADWLNLNGTWRFTFDPHNRGEHERWYRAAHPDLDVPASRDRGTLNPFGDRIVVPFPWESPLSGVHDTEYLGVAWYQRVIEVPPSWARADGTWRLHPWLTFGAIDWSARVWVNGRLVVEHEGGYAPFAVDLARHLVPGRAATLTVRACDYSDATTPVGKQTRRWYTHSSGIWQTVFLEGRPDVHVVRARVSTPLVPDPHAVLAIEVSTGDLAPGSPVTVEVASPDDLFPPARATVAATADGTVAHASVTVTPPDATLWSCESPHLYHATVTASVADSASADCPTDAVRTYFGIREVATGRYGSGDRECVLLNGKPTYLRGALDQAFHPDGVHAYPSDDAIRADVAAARDLGLNMLRCHIKVNDPRYYYWADVLGVLVMYDLPCTIVDGPTARRNWEATFREALDRDANHPSIIAWILFNETWGLERHDEEDGWRWVESMFHLCKSLDSTRLVEDNSPCLYDHVTSDLNSWHFYITSWDGARAHVQRVVDQTFPGSGFNYVGGKHGGTATRFVQGTAPLLNSEYAGLSARQGEKDIAHTFRYLTTDLRRHGAITGYVYTELTDIEWEHNGLVNYDREAKSFGYEAAFPGMSVADVNSADVVGFDAPPFQWVAPGAAVDLPAFVSHWGDAAIEGARLRWAIDVADVDGHVHRDVEAGGGSITLSRHGVTDAGRVTLAAPATWPGGVATVRLWLEDAAGTTRARNYAQLGIGAPPATTEPPSGEAHLPTTVDGAIVTWRPRPAAFADASWPQPRVAPGGEKLGAPGAGWVEYVLAVPGDVTGRTWSRLDITFEAGSRTAMRRRGWHDSRYFQPTDYPQGRDEDVPTRIEVTVNGVGAGTVEAPGDFADARGVLSLAAVPEWEYASAGTVLHVALEGDSLQEAARQDMKSLRVRLAVPEGPLANGLNLYGAGRGGSPVPFTVRLSLGQ